MVGGTARGVYKMLCSSPGWAEQHCDGNASFFAANIAVCNIVWRTHYKTFENVSAEVERLKLFYKSEYEVFLISGEEALRIEKGEAVIDSPGTISPKIVDMILSQGDQSQVIKITKEEFDQMLKDRDDEQP